MTGKWVSAKAYWPVFLWAVLATFAAILSSCGGGSSHNASMTPPPAPASNVQPVAVNAGPEGNYANGIFTSVKVCVPSSSNCQTIDNVLVDTGSYGLRVLSSAGGGALTLVLPPESASNGDPLGECAGFVSGFTWGPIKMADVAIGGETASKVPIQLIDPTFVGVPQPCRNGGVPENDTLQTLGANGILGIGPFAQDCGGACQQTGTQNPGWYYSCSSSACTTATVGLAQQVQNPISLFPVDNNGVIVELPAVSGPEPSLTGSLVFGIGTQSNNSLSGATVFPIDSNGEFTTTYKGQSYPAFVDSGSNAFFFLDANLSGLTVCSSNSGFYCPSSTTNLSAVTTGGAKTATINFSIGDASTLFATSANAVFSTLGGPNPGMFDWGLPFFYGRNVFTAIDGQTTPAGAGPYWAY
ncbi:MAG TPA: DUF3443 domain-containing protein [Candidatus Sulfotelmatobacter sp.]|nr:DUF3443 domain-containing protein [Candidatus Sulfotelmatobacter sp.]